MHTAAPSRAVHGAAVDEAWDDDLRLLLGPEAEPLLEAVAGATGQRLVSWRPRQVAHRPGRSTTVQYRAELDAPGERGGSTSMTYVAATGDRLPSSGAAVFEDGDRRVAVWRWDRDPFLPGLAAALEPSSVAGLLDDLGVGGGPVRLRVRAYRPGRRAVVEATGARGRVFLKVVPPAHAEALHRRHRLLSDGLPVPRSIGWSDAGIVVLEAMPGATLREALRGARRAVPPPEAVAALLDALPHELAAGRPRPDLLRAAAGHAGVLEATVPAASPLVRRLLDGIAAAPAAEQPVEPVHGDLYEAQLLVAGGRVTGLLDVDTAGPGNRIDDIANFAAHLSVLALVTDRPRPVKRYGAALLALGDQRYDRAALRARIAAAVLGLATGPFRVLEPAYQAETLRRLDLAASWLDLVPDDQTPHRRIPCN